MKSIRDEIFDRVKKEEREEKEKELKYQNERNAKIEECASSICTHISYNLQHERIWDHFYSKEFLGYKLHSGKLIIYGETYHDVRFHLSSDPFYLANSHTPYDEHYLSVVCNANDKKIIIDRVAKFLEEQNIKLVYSREPSVNAKKQYPYIIGYLPLSPKNIELALQNQYISGTATYIKIALFLDDKTNDIKNTRINQKILNCPRCNNKLRINNVPVGKTIEITCPVCQNKFTRTVE